jgi:IS5 family transposase
VSDLLRDGRRRFPFMERIFANAGYRGVENGDDGRRCGTRWKIEIVKPLRDLHRFVVLPKRRIVERTFAWISRNRPSRARLRTLCDNHRCLHSARHDPAHAQTLDQAKPLIMIPFLNRLLDHEY